MARKKKTEEEKPAEPNRVFLTISALGICDPGGKSVLSYGFKRNIAPADKPLHVVRDLLRVMIGFTEWPTPQVMLADVEELLRMVNQMHTKAKEQVHDDER